MLTQWNETAQGHPYGALRCRGSIAETRGTLTEVTLRRLHEDDAPALVAHLAKSRVQQHIAPPPSSVEGFRQFIRWTDRVHDRHVCLGIIPSHETRPVGLIQFWPLTGQCFDVSEWGFVMDDTYWGSGLFAASAAQALTFAFTTLGVHRLEARAAANNGRGNGVLEKLGAVREGILRKNFRCGGRFTDHVMWSMLANEWQPRRF